MEEDIKYCRSCGAKVVSPNLRQIESSDIICQSCGFLQDSVTPVNKEKEALHSNDDNTEIVEAIVDDSEADSRIIETVGKYKDVSVVSQSYSAERSFRRYKKQIGSVIKIGARTFGGEIIDYSDGACIIIKDNPVVDRGEIVEINGSICGLSLRGIIVWAEKIARSIRAGVRRVDNLKGSMCEFRPADILSGLYRSQATGTLELNSGEIKKKIYFKHGDIIFAESMSKDDNIGNFLLRERLITEKQYNTMMRAHEKTDREFGRLITELGIFSLKEFLKAVKLHAETIIKSIFYSEDMRFEFKEGAVPANNEIQLKLNTPDVIYQCIKNLNASQFLKEETLPADSVLLFSKGIAEIEGIVLIGEPEKKILSRIDGKTPIKKLLDLIPLSKFETIKTIHALNSIGIVKAA